jgi:hypothetical protein
MDTYDGEAGRFEIALQHTDEHARAGRNTVSVWVGTDLTAEGAQRLLELAAREIPAIIRYAEQHGIRTPGVLRRRGEDE